MVDLFNSLFHLIVILGSTCVGQCRQGSILQSVLPRTPESSPQVRLAGGTESEGRIEIFTKGRWGTVCVDDFDLIDGEVKDKY